jgi:large subunit ribosomal protein L9
MQVVLLERVEKLGQMGDVVKVKDGFARNFLLPRKKALRATKENIARFESQRSQLEARNLELKKEAEQVNGRLNGQSFVVLRQAGETGILYGSVSSRDISEALTNGGFTVARSQVSLDKPIKSIGMHDVRVVLHPEVSAKVVINVARSDEEAKRQAAGEDLTKVGTEEEVDAAEFFEDAALAPKKEGEEEETAPAEGEAQA